MTSGEFVLNYRYLWQFSLSMFLSVSSSFLLAEPKTDNSARCEALAADPFDPKTAPDTGVHDHEVDLYQAYEICFRAADAETATGRDHYNLARVARLVGDKYTSVKALKLAQQAGYDSPGLEAIYYLLMRSQVDPGQRRSAYAKIYDSGYTQIAYYEGLEEYAMLVALSTEGLSRSAQKEKYNLSVGYIWRAAIPADGVILNPHAVFLHAYFQYRHEYAYRNAGQADKLGSETFIEHREDNMQYAADHGMEIAKAYLAAIRALETDKIEDYRRVYKYLVRSLDQRSFVAGEIFDFMASLAAGDRDISSSTKFPSHLHQAAAKIASIDLYDDPDQSIKESVYQTLKFYGFESIYLQPNKALLSLYKTPAHRQKLIPFLNRESSFGSEWAQDEFLALLLENNASDDELKELLQFYFNVYRKTNQINLAILSAEIQYELGDRSAAIKTLDQIKDRVQRPDHALDISKLAYAIDTSAGDSLANYFSRSSHKYAEFIKDKLVDYFISKSKVKEQSIGQRKGWLKKVENNKLGLSQKAWEKKREAYNRALKNVLGAENRAMDISKFHVMLDERRGAVIELQKSVSSQLANCGSGPRPSGGELTTKQFAVLNSQVTSFSTCMDGVFKAIKDLRRKEWEWISFEMTSGEIIDAPVLEPAQQKASQFSAIRKRTLDEYNAYVATINSLGGIRTKSDIQIRSTRRYSPSESFSERLSRIEREGRRELQQRKWRDLCRRIDSLTTYKPITYQGC